MNTREVVEFFYSNEKDTIFWFLDKLIDNLKSSIKLLNKYFLMMISLVLIYYLLKAGSINSIKFTIVDITDLKIVKVVMAPLFTIVFLTFYILLDRIELLSFQSKVMFTLLHKKEGFEKSDLDRTGLNKFTISILPYFFNAELLSKQSSDMRFWDLLGLIPYLVSLICIGCGVYYFSGILLIDLYDLYCDAFLYRLIFWITCLFNFVSLFYVCRIILNNSISEKRNNEFWEEILKYETEDS